MALLFVLVNRKTRLGIERLNVKGAIVNLSVLGTSPSGFKRDFNYLRNTLTSDQNLRLFSSTGSLQSPNMMVTTQNIKNEKLLSR